MVDEGGGGIKDGPHVPGGVMKQSQRQGALEENEFGGS